MDARASSEPERSFADRAKRHLARRQFAVAPRLNVQMPLQRVVQRNALADQPLAMVHEQPEIEFGARQLRRGQGVQPFAQRRPRDRDRVNAVGLPARASAATRVGHQLRRHAQDQLAAFDQNALEGARDMSAVLGRPHPFAPERPSPDDKRGEALLPAR